VNLALGNEDVDLGKRATLIARELEKGATGN